MVILKIHGNHTNPKRVTVLFTIGSGSQQLHFSNTRVEKHTGRIELQYFDVVKEKWVLQCSLPTELTAIFYYDE